MRCFDVAIVGGGPAGLAASIESARRGLSTLVIERQRAPPDKACGEGLMPRGWAALEALGAAPVRFGRFEGIRYLQENGAFVAARFRQDIGRGVRRLELSAALEAAALREGVEIQGETPAHSVVLHDDHVTLVAGEAPVEARLLVAADGLASPLRRQVGLEVLPTRARRYGIRRHFRGIATSGFVDVHWAPGTEAYVTPLSDGRCGVAFLFEAGREASPSFESLLARFPRLAEQLNGSEVDSEARGAGPFLRRVRGVHRGRLVLVGDAAGYVDAITGEGLSLAFESAHALGAVLPAALEDPSALNGYARAHRRLYRRYALAASALVWLARHPAARRSLFDICVRWPFLFELGLHLAVGDPTLDRERGTHAGEADSRTGEAGPARGEAPHHRGG